MRSPAILDLSLVLVLLVAGACGSDSAAPGGNRDRLRVVASTAVIAEFATIVAGDDGVEVSSLTPPGVDLHSFEPAPATAAAIAEADLIFVNGYNLEEGLLDVILENVADAAEVVAVASGLTPLDGIAAAASDVIRAEGDPHFWLDAANAAHYVEQIADRLATLDPEHAAGYKARAAAYVLELDLLDDELRETIGAIPEASRELVVFHDAYRYFASAYGISLTASVLPAGAQQDPSAAAVAELIELIEERAIAAVYREPQFGASVLDSIAEETGAKVLVLRSTFSDHVDSYIEMMRANAAALVAGLAPSAARGHAIGAIA